MAGEGMEMNVGDWLLLELALMSMMSTVDPQTEVGLSMSALMGKVEYNIQRLKEAAGAAEPVPSPPPRPSA